MFHYLRRMATTMTELTSRVAITIGKTPLGCYSTRFLPGGPRMSFLWLRRRCSELLLNFPGIGNALQHSKMLLLILVVWNCGASFLLATDYFLTLGGGYDRSGNQASLEANVLFFQQLLVDKHRGRRRHEIFFADGDDPAADLQTLREKPAQSATPATDLLAALHRRRGGDQVGYRDHRVAGTTGSLNPSLIRAAFADLARQARLGDRVIIYVTAHGNVGPKDDPFNTTIDCWNGRKITAREFTDWLSQVPSEVHVIMVMAQCYCGGFGRAIFEGLDVKRGLAPQLRVGFFAQQHNLPAAGCRPDIEHDEEFSSYFWGALAGRSRNGLPIVGCDVDENGAISFAEAYAYAVTAGETIDIPLRTSEVLLRTYSRLPAVRVSDTASNSEPESGELENSERATDFQPILATMCGRLETFVEHGSPVSRRIVTQLATSLGFSLQDDVTAITKALETSRRAHRSPGSGRPRQGSGRRELLQEVTEKWPELADERKWPESALLKSENQEQMLAELRQLPSWKTYDERRRQLEVANAESDQREIRLVKFRKLTNALEVIALERNLHLVATAEIVERYRQLLALEDSTLSNSEN